MWWHTLLGVLAGVLLVYLMLLALLWRYGRRHPDAVGLRDALRLLPDLLRLLRRLAADNSLPFGVRARLVLLWIYLASPIDLVPDFIPVVGYADDVIVVAWCSALSSVAPDPRLSSTTGPAARPGCR